jgi:hypothetical protein
MTSPENSPDEKTPDFRAEGDTDNVEDVKKQSIDDIDKPDKGIVPTLSCSMRPRPRSIRRARVTR